MAFWENLKSKYGDYDKWKKEKVTKPIEEKFAGTPLGSFESLKGYLGGIPEKIKEIPGKLKTGWEGFKKEPIEVGLPGQMKDIGSPEQMWGSIKNMLKTPKQMQSERHEELFNKIKGTPDKIVPDVLPSATQQLPANLLESIKNILTPSYPATPKAIEDRKEVISTAPTEGMPPGYTPEGVSTGVMHGPALEGTALGEGLKEMGVSEPSAVDTGKLLIGVTDESKKLAIQGQISKINSQLDVLRGQLEMKPGLTLEQKTAYEQMAKGWAEAGASAEQIAQMIDNLTRADADKISNKIIPTYDKYLKSPEVTKAKDTLEGLYTKYSDREKDLNDKTTEANQAINAIKQSPYLTQSMIVGRTDRMRDEYNMEINSIRNDLNTLGADIDRGRDALKTLMDEGFKMAGVEIGALGVGIEEDIMKRMPFGYESILNYLRGQPGQPPATIGAGKFGWTGEGYEQVTPFAPQTPTATGEKQVVTEEHKHYLEGLAGEDGFVSLEDFMSMMEDWMYRTGSYNPQQYVSMFARRYLSPENRTNLPMELLGMGG